MQAWLAALMPDLEALGWECWLALPSGRFNDADGYLANYPWPRVRKLENPAGTKWGRERAVRAVLSQVQPDVTVVANLVTVYETIERLRWTGRATPRLIMCSHTFDPGIFADLERFVGVVDGFVAPNRLMERAATELARYPAERVRYASYGVDLPRLDPPRASSRLEIVFCARLEEEQKRLLDLPRIAEALAHRGVEFRLQIVGGGPDEARLRAAVASSSAATHIELVGPVAPDRLLSDYFQPGRILLLTSSWENGPIVLWQAAARGLTVVSSRFLGSGLERALIAEENCLQFSVGDADAAALALSRLRDGALRARLAVAGRRTVERRFSRQVSATAWDAALRDLAARPLRPVMNRPPAIPRSGRLDRILGLAGADLGRRLMRRPAKLSGPGDEWPHISREGAAREAFFAELGRLDQGPLKGALESTSIQEAAVESP